MKKIGFAILMAMACVLIAGCVGEKTMPNGPYTVEHKILMNFYPVLELTITGPPDDLLVFISDGEKESKTFIPREQMASGEGKARFSFGSSIPAKSYKVTIKKSDPSKSEGPVVYKGRINFQGGSLEVVDVSVMSKWPVVNTYARLYNSGDLPITIDYFVVYSDKGERKWSSPITIAPGEEKDIIVLYEGKRNRDIRLYLYSNDKVVAKFEGKIG